LKKIEVLENDIKKLRHEISIFQSHVQKTELWCDNIGKFTTNVVGARSTQLDQNNAESVVLFEIHVQLHERFDIIHDYELSAAAADSTSGTSKEATSSTTFKEGWIIYRNVKEFEGLNEHLNELLPAHIKPKFKKIPNLLKRSFASSKSVNEEKQEKARLILDDYLRVISEDEKLAQSEALYTFLCPSPGYFKKSSDIGGSDEKFSLSNLFRGGGSSAKTKEVRTEDEYLDELFSDTNLRMLDTNARDSIAEPFYHLIEEIFGLKTIRKWFRKSLILFVQLTYGATINRKIRESIYWTLSSDMLAFYFKQIKDSFWKRVDDRTELIVYEAEVRGEADKLATRRLAREKLISSIPEPMLKLVGEKNTHAGLVKLFDLFQDKKLNKHLIYVRFLICQVYLNQL
jgi:sorting nexin-25